MVIEYVLKKNNNPKNEKAYGKYYAKPKVTETVDIDGLSEHMDNHNTPFTKGTIKGLLTDTVAHIKELLLEGKNVKLDDLAIFSIGIKNKKGADTEEDFNTRENIAGVRLRARATGDLTSANLNLEASLKKATTVKAASSSGSGNTSSGDSGSAGGSKPSGSDSGSTSSGGGSSSDGGNIVE